MNAATKLGVYFLGLALVFGGALGAGNAVRETAPPEPARQTAHGAPAAHDHGGHGTAKGETPGGLQVSENGYTLTPLTTVEAGEPAEFRFTVSGPDGRPVTDYQVQHDKKLHFIVVSRDLASFQHLHPVLGGDGVWSVPLRLKEPGAYRVFADFAPAGGSGLTLGADVLVAGEYAPRAAARVSRAATVDDYTVYLRGDLVPGQASRLTLSVSKGDKPVTDLQRYLGAYGHLVALRGGDLAYLHVHPEDGATAGPEITFYAQVPSGGEYRLFLDFQHEGKVRTAAFTARAVWVKQAIPSDGHDHTH
ncbi:hypothetical protein ACIBQ1_04175 [Nonomuraea sp. NPDC050153]|uniref:hypothetical protein n=1 Tax=Nonomuraea sp. NPDC050153 TaxID=3364359 RepID=UPI00378F7C97